MIKRRKTISLLIALLVSASLLLAIPATSPGHVYALEGSVETEQESGTDKDKAADAAANSTIGEDRKPADSKAAISADQKDTANKKAEKTDKSDKSDKEEIEATVYTDDKKKKEGTVGCAIYLSVKFAENSSGLDSGTTAKNLYVIYQALPAPTGVNLRFLPWILIAIAGGAIVLTVRRRRSE